MNLSLEIENDLMESYEKFRQYLREKTLILSTETKLMERMKSLMEDPSKANDLNEVIDHNLELILISTKVHNNFKIWAK